MNMRFVLAVAAGVLAGSPVALQAATFTKYNDRAAFTAAAGNVGIESFAAATPSTKIGSGLDFGAFTITETQFGSYGGGSQILGGGTNSVNGTNYVSANLYDYPGVYGSYLTFTFDTPITAFGGNWVSGSTNNVYLDVLGSMVDGHAGTGGGFFGFISDTPFTKVVMRSRLSNFGAGVDNLTFSTTSAAPEPASWAMMVGGFGLIGGALRSRRKQVVRFA